MHSKIYDDVLDAIGHTPMIRLNKIPKLYNLKCKILAKCEFSNVGGSIKDRIGKRMIIDAEQQGILVKGKTLIEATSGNTGIGMAITAAIKQYPLWITMPDKMSQEKEDILLGLGVKVIRTKTVSHTDPESLYRVTERIVNENDNFIYLNQFNNQSNVQAHYDETATEILYQCDNQVTAVVVTVGTGGTITGIGKKMHEQLPNCKIIGVDPVGSKLAEPNSESTPFLMEGIGKDFTPQVLDRNQVDYWIKTTDKDGFLMARQIMQQEGLLCGGSSGAALIGAIQWAKEQDLNETDTIVVVFPDGIRNYLSKHLSEDWMIERRLMEMPQNQHSNTKQDFPIAITLNYHQSTIADCLPILKATMQIGIPLISDNQVIAIVFLRKLLKSLSDNILKKTDLAQLVSSKEFVLLNQTELSYIPRAIEKHEIIFINNMTIIKYLTPQLYLQSM